jgi:ketosteroid isomerase-like protein
MTGDHDALVADRSDIEQLLASYAHAVDRRDFAAVAACFTPDATAQYSGMELGPGVDAIISHISGVERFPASQHIFAPPLVHVDGDAATASSHAVSHLVVPGEAGDTLLSRGLVYDDRLVRTPTGWRIARRVHRPQWSTEIPISWGGSPPATLGP